MDIRRATVEDAWGIADVHVRTWQGAYEHVFGAERLAALSVEQRLPGWQRSLGEPEQHAFVAEEDGRIIGFVDVGPSRDPAAEGELWGIYVEPESWGSPAGAALMRVGLDELRALGYRNAVLRVLEDNPRARRFYEREGWRADGRIEGEHMGVRTAEVRYRIDL